MSRGYFDGEGDFAVEVYPGVILKTIGNKKKTQNQVFSTESKEQH